MTSATPMPQGTGPYGAEPQSTWQQSTGPQGTGPQGTGPKKGRGGLIAVLLCAGILCLAMILVIGGGITFLLVQRHSAAQIETRPLEAEGFSTVVPAEWEVIEEDTSFTFEDVIVVETEDGDQRLRITRVLVELEPDSQCELLMDSSKEQGLANESAEILEPIEIDGVEAVHYQWIGTDDGAWHQGDAYCMVDDIGTLFVLAENSDPDEATELAFTKDLFEAWSWAG